MIQSLNDNKYLILLIIIIILILLFSYYIYHLFQTQWPLQITITNNSKEDLKLQMILNVHYDNPIKNKKGETIFIVKAKTKKEFNLSDFIISNPITNKAYKKQQVYSLTFKILSENPNANINVYNIPYNTSLYESSDKILLRKNYISKKDFIGENFVVKNKYYYTLKFINGIVF